MPNESSIRFAIWMWLAFVLFCPGLARSVFAAPQTGSHSVTLTWSPAVQPGNETVASWNVYRSGSNGSSYTSIASVPVEIVTYTDTSVIAGGAYSYVVTAIDTAGNESAYSASVSATIPSGSVPLSITTSALAASTVGANYNATLSAAGGNPPYTWTGSGVPGLTVSVAGLLAGTVTQSGTFNETVMVTDSSGMTASASFPISAVAQTPPPTVPPSTGTLPSGLALYWTFDNAYISNGVVTDQSGNGNTGTLFGNLQFVAGILGQALSFDGSTTYISAGNAATLTHSLTLAAWINTANASRTETIFSKFDASGSGRGYIFTTNQNGNLAVRIGAADISAYPNLVTDPTVINDGKWHNVVAAISFELQTIQFYVDGKLTSSTAVNMVPNGDGGAGLQVGVNPWTGYGDFFTGAMDEVQVYDRALTDSEVNTVYLLSGGT
jgi:hypothetical protein